MAAGAPQFRDGISSTVELLQSYVSDSLINGGPTVDRGAARRSLLWEMLTHASTDRTRSRLTRTTNCSVVFLTRGPSAVKR